MRWNRALGVAGIAMLEIAGLSCSSDSSGPPPTPVPTTVTVTGNLQSGPIGAALPVPIGVTVKDQGGAPMAGVVVTFGVTAGGGVIAVTAAATNAQGLAAATWILGNTVGASNNTATANVPGYAGTVPVFTASGTPIVSAYNIDLRFLTPMSPSQTAAFTAAAARWSSIVIGDLPASRIIAAPGDCFPNSPAQDEVVDDLLIFATVDSIDGPGTILGGASGCWFRNIGSLTIVGGMVFDSADMGLVESRGLLNALILHEMGHVLGIGQLWPFMNPSLLTGGGTTNPYFTGASGVFQFGRDGGSVYPGIPVPVENTGVVGDGTRDGHWREAVMGRELMTGFISLSSNPLSTITVGSLADMAYTVSYANADPYAVSGVNLRIGGGGEGVQLVEMRPNVTMKRVDAQGRIMRGR
jgi:hypothetical protein